MEGLLRHVRANGLQPGCVIDVGAYVGDWSRIAASVFPDASLIMVEGDPERESTLAEVARDLGSRARVIIGVLGSSARDQVAFHTAGPGSSIFPELTTFERGTRLLSMTTLDGMLDARSGPAGLRAPLLLKLDVQGAELEVLKGGPSTLARAELVILETSTIPYNEGAPLAAEVIRFMSERGFVIYDFCGQCRRESDNTLYQTDIAFVRADSMLRASKKFWATET